ncbi:MAG: glycosyltransferase [Flavobacteriaceae bacterium]|nr:glycosyltransferase [Flavobacteriaceae bacterium]
MFPTLSVIIPTYNRAHFISETLNSIIAQTYLNWECIIVDDYSSDNITQVVKPFLLDKRFSYYKRPKNLMKGANSCRNYGFEKSKGDYIHWLDSDDIIHPDCYKTCLNILIENDFDFCRFEREVFFNNFDKIKLENNNAARDSFLIDILKFEQILTNEIPFNTCNVIWKKSSIGKERFNERIVYADEWEYYLRLISNNLKGISISLIFLFARKHQDSTTFEFYNNNSIRVTSKKEAIKLVAQNLMNKQLMTPTLLKYLVGYAISFRDIILLNDILSISNTSLKNKLYLKLKFHLFPIWKIYKRTHKKIT